MRIVAIDTSARVGSIALLDGRELLFEAAVGMERKHGERLLPTLRWAMASVGWAGDSVQLVATTRGPGPFTAIRVGVTAAKSLAYGWGVGAVGFPTPDAIAHGYRYLSRPLHVLFDARKQQVYSAVYRPDPAGGGLAREGEIECCAVEDALRAAQPNTLYVGDGAHAYRDAIEALGAPGSDLGDAAAATCRAGSVGALAGEGAAWESGAADVHALAPIYVRRPEAIVRVEGAPGV